MSLRCSKLLTILKKDPTDSQHYQISEFSLKMEKKSLFFLLFLNKIQMFEFQYCSNYSNVCVELKMPLAPDFAADFRYRSQSLLVTRMGNTPKMTSFLRNRLQNKAVYTTESVTYGLAGAVMQFRQLFSNKFNSIVDQRTD